MNTPTPWDVHDMRGQGDLLHYLQAARARAIAQASHRKRLVLTQPDLADRLAEALQLASARQWSGFVPPTHDAIGAPNRSPIRAAVAEVVAQAEQRAGS